MFEQKIQPAPQEAILSSDQQSLDTDSYEQFEANFQQFDQDMQQLLSERLVDVEGVVTLSPAQIYDAIFATKTADAEAASSPPGRDLKLLEKYDFSLWLEEQHYTTDQIEKLLLQIMDADRRDMQEFLDLDTQTHDLNELCLYPPAGESEEPYRKRWYAVLAEREKVSNRSAGISRRELAAACIQQLFITEGASAETVMAGNRINELLAWMGLSQLPDPMTHAPMRVWLGDHLSVLFSGEMTDQLSNLIGSEHLAPYMFAQFHTKPIPSYLKHESEQRQRESMVRDSLNLLTAIPRQEKLLLPALLKHRPSDDFVAVLKHLGWMGSEYSREAKKRIERVYESLGGYRCELTDLIAPLDLNHNFKALLLDPISTSSLPPDQAVNLLHKMVNFSELTPSHINSMQTLEWVFATLEIPPKTTRVPFLKYSYSRRLSPNRQEEIGNTLREYYHLWPNLTSRFMTVEYKGRDRDQGFITLNYPAFEQVRNRIRVEQHTSHRIQELLAQQDETSLEDIENLVRDLGIVQPKDGAGQDAELLSTPLTKPIPISAHQYWAVHLHDIDRNFRRFTRTTKDSDSYSDWYYGTVPETWVPHRALMHCGANSGLADQSHRGFRKDMMLQFALNGLSQIPPSGRLPFSKEVGTPEIAPIDSVPLSELGLSQRELEHIIEFHDGGISLITGYSQIFDEHASLSLNRQLLHRKLDTAITAYSKLLADDRLQVSHPLFERYLGILHLLQTLPMTGETLDYLKFNRKYMRDKLPYEEPARSKLLAEYDAADELLSNCTVEPAHNYIARKMHAEYSAAYLPAKQQEFAVTQAVPPVCFDRMPFGHDTTIRDFEQTVGNLPADIAPVTYSLDVGDTLTVSGANGAGKSVFVTTMLAAYATNLAQRWGATDRIPVAVTVTSPANYAISVLELPEADEEKSLFQSGARSLAQFIAERLRQLEGLGSQPHLLFSDEWGIGTDVLARVAILKATEKVLRRRNPHLTFIHASHEASDHLAADALLYAHDDQPRTHNNEVIAIDPVTRKPLRRIDSPSFAELALERGDPETAQKAALVKELLTAEIEELDLSDVPERDIDPKHECVGMLTETDLDRLGFRESAISGQFAFLRNQFSHSGVSSRYIDQLTLIFANSFRSIATGDKQSTQGRIERIRKQQTRVLNLGAEAYSNMLKQIGPSLESLQPFSSQTSDLIGVINIHKLLADTKTLQAAVTSFAEILEEDDKTDIIESMKKIGENAEQIRSDIMQEASLATARWLVRTLVDSDQLAQYISEYNEHKKLDDSLQDPLFEWFTGKTIDNNAVVKHAVDLMQKGDFSYLISLHTTFSNRKTELKELFGESVESHISESTLLSNKLLRELISGTLDTVSSGSKLVDDPLLSHAALSFQMPLLLGHKTADAYTAVANQLESTVMSLGTRALIRNTDEVSWCKPTTSESDSNQIKFTNATDLAVYAKVGKTDYVPQNLDTSESVLPDAGVTVLSGPNAEGKSSLSAFMLNLPLWAHVLGWVPAEEAVFDQVDQVAISLNAFVPKPELGLSGLGAQGADIVRIVDQIRSLQQSRREQGLPPAKITVVLDEIFNVTSADGQRDLTAIVTEQLIDAGARVVLSSHDAGLKHRVEQINQGRVNSAGKESIRLIEHTVEAHQVTYDVRGQSLPYKILRKEMENVNVPPDVIDEIITEAQRTESELRILHHHADAIPAEVAEEKTQVDPANGKKSDALEEERGKGILSRFKRRK